MGFRTERWRVCADSAPRVWRHCSGCGEQNAFVCSDKFRVNAQKKIIDVWLIYKCMRCDATWNYPIVSRCSVNSIAKETRYAFEQNDKVLARRYALDTNALRRYCEGVESSDSFAVERTDLRVVTEVGDRILFEVEACEWRLDRLLSRELGISRNRLCDWENSGRICVRPDSRKPLRKSIRPGLEVTFIGLRVLIGES